MEDKTQKIFVAGHNGMVGSAICRVLAKNGYSNIITRDRSELDLTNQAAVKSFFDNESINQVYLAAAKVGGIHANNTYPAEFIYENLMIEANVIHEAWRTGVERLLVLGSSCIYPKLSQQPIVESELLTGKIEPTNEPYGVAKIAGIKLCESYRRQYGADFRSVMPTNLYGLGDNYHPENSHVIPALIRRFYEAKENGVEKVEIWGSGNQYREFLYVDDMAAASVFIMELDREAYEGQTEPLQGHINIGYGEDITIKQLVSVIKQVVGYEGQVEFDISKPDGPPRKLVDSTRIKELGWAPSVNLQEGVKAAFGEFIAKVKS